MDTFKESFKQKPGRFRPYGTTGKKLPPIVPPKKKEEKKKETIFDDPPTPGSMYSTPPGYYENWDRNYKKFLLQSKNPTIV